MKKSVFIAGALFVLLSCNSNPQETGSEIIMEHERESNPIEHQTDAITAPAPSQVVPIDSTIRKDSAASHDTSSRK